MGDKGVVAGQYAVVSGDSPGLALLHVIYLNLIVVIFAYPDRSAIEAQSCGMVFLVQCAVIKARNRYILRALHARGRCGNQLLYQ